MSYLTLSKSKKIIFSREAISIALSDAELATVLSQFGFAPDTLNAGRVLQETVETFDADKQRAFGIRVELTNRVETLQADILKAFRTDRRIAKFVFKDLPGSLEQLGVSVKIKGNRDDLHQQMKHFYQELLNNEDLQASMAVYNITAETLSERLSRVAELTQAMEELQVQRATALLMTQRRLSAQAELDEWMSQFLGVAKQAFRGDKKQLEKLGLRVK